MPEQNTYPCRGCGQPFLEKRPRGSHESHCPQYEPEEHEEPAEPEEADSGQDQPSQEPEESEDHEEPDQMEDQDQYRESPPEAPPETPSPVQPDPDPQPPDRKALDFGDGTCQCCGSEVGNTTRAGLCWGCDLAGCGTESPGCEHHKEGSTSA